MARLNRDHSGYHSHGLYTKYQQPSVNDFSPKQKSKKNTKKWCGGKVGREHDLIRYFWHTGWSGTRTKWIRTKCAVCHKEFYHTNNPSVPLIVELDEKDGIRYPIQVKVNGKAIPFSEKVVAYINSGYGGWWCDECKDWHR